MLNIHHMSNSASALCDAAYTFGWRNLACAASASSSRSPRRVRRVYQILSAESIAAMVITSFRHSSSCAWINIREMLGSNGNCAIYNCGTRKSQSKTDLWCGVCMALPESIPGCQAESHGHHHSARLVDAVIAGLESEDLLRAARGNQRRSHRECPTSETTASQSNDGQWTNARLNHSKGGSAGINLQV